MKCAVNIHNGNRTTVSGSYVTVEYITLRSGRRVTVTHSSCRSVLGACLVKMTCVPSDGSDLPFTGLYRLYE